MANVQAAASEASNTYKAYSSANLLSATKTFYIPIYTGLDSNIDGFTVTGRGDGGKSLWLDWYDVAGAAKYIVYDVTNGANTLKGTVTASEFKFTDLTPAWEYDIKVIAYSADGTILAQKHILQNLCCLLARERSERNRFGRKRAERFMERFGLPWILHSMEHRRQL